MARPKRFIRRQDNADGPMTFAAEQQLRTALSKQLDDLERQVRDDGAALCPHCGALTRKDIDDWHDGALPGMRHPGKGEPRSAASGAIDAWVGSSAAIPTVR